jgi:tryptophan-rich sensory protein
MTVSSAILISIGICIIAAIIEGVCAGKNVKAFFAKLQFPPYSAPLWLWSIIGVLYYGIFGFVLYRLFILNSASALWRGALLLTLFMMLANALTNYVIFRARNLRLSYIIGNIFPIMDISLFICLIRLDTIAALSLIPYLLYRIYAVWWGYALWKLNPSAK